MTDPAEILRQHQQVCDELYQCVLEENRHLRQHGIAPGEEHLARKRLLLARLDGAVDAMRQVPSGAARAAGASAQAENGRARILQILQLERENEQLHARGSRPDTRPAAAASAAGMLQKIYSRSA